MRMNFAVLFCILAYSPAKASDRWITFRTADKPGYGAIAHQIDRTSIAAENGYRVFWTRQWRIGRNEVLALSHNEALFFPSEKFAVDCTGHRFGSRALDSNDPTVPRTSLAAMRWQPLDKTPVVAKIVCGGQ